LAGIFAITNNTTDREALISYFINSLQMLQHRGKAYWKIIIDNLVSSGIGPFPADGSILKLVDNNSNLRHMVGLGYLSKRTPRFKSMNKINVILDGFFVDIEKLHLHPLIGNASSADSLYKIYCIFKKLLIDKENPEKACEFLDRHLRGNLTMLNDGKIYSYRDSTGFKPLVSSTDKNKSISIIASENSLRIPFPRMNFQDIRPGQLIKMDTEIGQEKILSLPTTRTMIDPFEFIRESHVTATIGGKGIYEVRKRIGKVQADFLSRYSDIDIEAAYAEPDYPRPMTLGFSAEYRNHLQNFDLGEAIINDRYDDSDRMIDFSENISKNKMITSGKSLKYILKHKIGQKKIGLIQGTIQTGITTKESIYYLRKVGVGSVSVIVSYVPTVDGRQVGLYTQNRELIAHKYIGQVASLEELNTKISKELGADKVFYNSPSILSKGIGISEYNLWFPEWVRFLEYHKR
jgi:amidophosphoribosyltransferase